ncbi:hypothetical protein CHS0354_004028 [Potamilus streckersoni]|uniref:Uncharacterized protein n=1 Tax=Potamilus streckersoni TaxID=2493646 RepID=A0AAE0VN87_9BIVA|nr:hypothetical protein CHS0354_004028 [Potamilus streckersoni]
MDNDMASCTGRNVQLDEDEIPYRKGSQATIRSEGSGTRHHNKRGITQMYDSLDSLDSKRESMRIRRISSLSDGSIRFPKLEDCAHFHYDFVELGSLQVSLAVDDYENYHHNGADSIHHSLHVRVHANDKTWIVRRTLENFCMLDKQLHRCIFDRKFSHLPNLNNMRDSELPPDEVEDLLSDYLQRFSSLAGSMLNCGSVLNWIEIDNRGNRLVALDDSGINTPAIAAAHAVKRYNAQAADEISLEVGDIVSVIDMPPSEDTIWWRGKRGFEVGFFPHHCVEVIGDKVPASVATRIPETPPSRRALMRKHGKLLSFLRTFFNNRPPRTQLKQTGIVKERVFGCDLGEHLLNSGHDVPLVLKSCSEVIESSGIVDGIYRLSGITSNIQKLRLAFDEDRVPDLTSETYLQDIHSISSLLKMYFRELPNPLLTYQLYDKFADAVKDEDNKLLRIHDVVQQLPPPHYRTLHYLMHHLARVAAHGHETGMHSKNLAIVWAPNLLRSKELESGGGAAALQGVGIQAVVTECLIVYADLIFSDKMPSYSSPDLQKTQRKPRPKSLAISTPTRLLSLEEARERALNSSLGAPQQKFIDVGGGPSNLPAKYHTVLDLQGYRKKGPKDGAQSLKNKKSPGGLKSLFTRSRSGSIRQKGVKPSIHESLNFEIGDRKAITEEDVQHWKRRRIRSAKSAESLLTLPTSSRPGSYFTPAVGPVSPSSSDSFSADDLLQAGRHQRSQSSEPSDIFADQGHSRSYPSFVLEDSGTREMPIDVDVSVTPDTIDTENQESEKETSASPENKTYRKQSFIRDDCKRRVIQHRRTPSAPSTPRMDKERDKPHDDRDEYFATNLQQKTMSQPVLDSAFAKKPPKSDRQRQPREAKDSTASSSSVSSSGKGQSEEGPTEKRKGSKTPPKDRKKMNEAKEKSPSTPKKLGRVTKTSPKDKSRIKDVLEPMPGTKGEDIITIELPESPGSRRKLWTSSTSSTPEEPPDGAKSLTGSICSMGESADRRNFAYYFSRHHDYAEIDSDEESKIKDIQSVNVADDLPVFTLSDEIDTDTEPNVLLRKATLSERETVIDGSMEESGGYDNVETVSLPANISQTNIQSAVEMTNQRFKVTSISGSEFLERSESIERQEAENFRSLSQKMFIDSAKKMGTTAKSTTQTRSEKISCNENLQHTINSDSFSSSTIEQIKLQKEMMVTKTSEESISSSSDITSSSEPYYQQIYGEKHFQNIPKSLHGVHSADSDNIPLLSPDSPQSDSGVHFRRGGGQTRKLGSSGGNRHYKANSDTLVEISNLEQEIQSMQNAYPAKKEMLKCMSIPSDIEKSLENLTSGSHSDPMSSVTISELSQSQESFNKTLEEEDFQNSSLRRRRSASLDGFPEDSPLTRTLKEINEQIDKAFNREVGKIKKQVTHGSLQDISNYCTKVSAEFGASTQEDTKTRSVEAKELMSIKEKSFCAEKKVSTGNSLDDIHVRVSLDSEQGKFVDRPGDIQIVETPRVIRAPLKPRQDKRINIESIKPESDTEIPQIPLPLVSLQISAEKEKENMSRPKIPDSLLLDEEFDNVPPRSNIAYKSSNEKGDFDNLQMKSLISGEQNKKYCRIMEEADKTKQGFGVPRKKGSTLTSPLSPEHQLPRWEDLAGLNDLATFNDSWRQQLAPTGDTIRQAQAADDRCQEVETGSDTVVIERSSIKRTNVAQAKQTSFDSALDFEFKVGNFSRQSSSEMGEKRDRRERTPEIGTDHTTVISERQVIKKSSTVPGSLPMVPSDYRGEREVTPETGTETTVVTIEKPTITKSSTLPALSRQQSFESSVILTSHGSFEERRSVSDHSKLFHTGSFDEYQSGTECTISDVNSTAHSNSCSVSMGSSHNVSVSMGGAVVSKTTANISQSTTGANQLETSQSAFSISTHQTSQSSGFLSSHIDQSDDMHINSVPVSQSFPQLLNEIDVNESCLGIAAHQNLSNEMKEMMQEQMKGAGIISPEFEQKTFSFDVENNMNNSFDSRVLSPENMSVLDLDPMTTDQFLTLYLPSENTLHLTEGPTIVATPVVLSMLDNTEEALQNEVNADLERNMARTGNLPSPHATVCENSTNIVNSDAVGTVSNIKLQTNISEVASSLHEHAPGLEHLSCVGASDLPAFIASSKLCYQDSQSSSSSSSFLDSTLHSHGGFDSLTFSAARNNQSCPDLEPPKVEILEVCKATFTRPNKSLKKLPDKTKESERGEHLPSSLALKKQMKSKDPEVGDFGEQSIIIKDYVSSERGEAKLVIDRRPSLKKMIRSAEKVTMPRKHMADHMDSDHGEFSGTEDEVFIDVPNVDQNALGSLQRSGSNFQGFFSKTSRAFSFDMSDYLETASKESRVTNEACVSMSRSSQDVLARSSLDESIMQFASSHHDDLLDLDRDSSEDLRFSKAHRSSKLMSLCELFEKGHKERASDGSDVGESEMAMSSSRELPSAHCQWSSLREPMSSEEKEVDFFAKPVLLKKVQFPQNVEDSDEISERRKGDLGPKGQRDVNSRNLQKSQGDVNSRKPPKYRSSSKTRTPSESSLSESEGGMKGSPNMSHLEGSPKSNHYEGSQKGLRYSQTSSDESGSPQISRQEVSSKGVRCNRSSVSDDGSPQLVRQGGSPWGMVQGRSSFSDEGSPQLQHQGLPSKRKSSVSDDGSPQSPRHKVSPTLPQSKRSLTEETSLIDTRSTASPRGFETRDSLGCESSSKLRVPQEQFSELFDTTRVGNMGWDMPEKSDLDQTVNQDRFELEDDSKEKGTKGSKVKRKGSIKELRQIFESKHEKPEESQKGRSPPIPQKSPRYRVRSVSPGGYGQGLTVERESNVRHSLEIVPGIGPDGTFKPQQLRLGPKPFYGAKN